MNNKTDKLDTVIVRVSGYGDSLVPMDVVKECIDELQEPSYAAQVKVLRGQIGILGSDDTQFFSRQLTGEKLAAALKEL